MRVRLDFEVDGAHYRVGRRMGRARHDVSLERIVDGKSISELDRGGVQAVNDRLEEIVGLDFSAFTKAVLLPQGAFHEFLTGDKAERRRILTRLLDLNRYERAGQAARREATRLDAIIGERDALIESNYQDATKEHLKELKKAVKAASDHYAKLEQARDQGRQIAKLATEGTKTVAAITDTARQLEDARVELDGLAEAWPPLHEESTTAENALAQTQAALGEADKKLEQARKRLAATTKRTGDSALLVRLEEAALALSREQEALTELEAALALARENAAELGEALQVAKTYQDARKKAAEEGKRARKQAESEQQMAEAVAECALRAAALSALEEQLAPTQQRADALEKEAVEARKQLKHLEQEHAAVALRAGLSAGDQCPVCESIIETLPGTPRDIETLLSRARQALRRAEAHAEQAKTASVALEAQRSAAVDELENARTVLPKKIKLPTPNEAKVTLSEAKLAASAAQKAEADAQDALERATEHLSAAKELAAAATEKVEGLTSSRDGTTERLETARTTLTNGFNGKLPRQIDTAIAKRREELGTSEQERDDAAESLERARHARDETQAATTAIVERVSAFDNDLATVRTATRIACDALARGLEAQMMPAIPDALVERADALASWSDCCDGHLAAANEAIVVKEAEVAAAAKQLELLAITAGVAVATAEPVEIEAELERAVTAAHGAVIAAEKDVETLTKRIDERTQMEEAIAEDRRLRTVYNTLARDLRADHFLSWVLEESMSQLADQASIELLRISDERYSLVADGGNFDVIDHSNADEKRSVATLSGGETFLASLSLALALAVGLRELVGTAAGRLDAIFIDEGFGALDPETLDVVVDALERLREGDRMVGVITHVPTLADRIPTGLVVEKSGASSRIVVR